MMHARVRKAEPYIHDVILDVSEIRMTDKGAAMVLENNIIVTIAPKDLFNVIVWYEEEG